MSVFMFHPCNLWSYSYFRGMVKITLSIFSKGCSSSIRLPCRHISRPSSSMRGHAKKLLKPSLSERSPFSTLLHAVCSRVFPSMWFWYKHTIVALALSYGSGAQAFVRPSAYRPVKCIQSLSRFHNSNWHHTPTWSASSRRIWRCLQRNLFWWGGCPQGFQASSSVWCNHLDFFDIIRQSCWEFLVRTRPMATAISS